MKRGSDGRITECSPAEFGQLLEGYFGGKYTKVQTDEIARWVKRRSPRTLAMVYRYCVINEETAYGKPPGVKRLNANLAEVMESYPELRAEASHEPALLEDARPETDVEEWFAAWRSAVERGENPAEAEEMQHVLEKHGVSGR